MSQWLDLFAIVLDRMPLIIIVDDVDILSLSLSLSFILSFTISLTISLFLNDMNLLFMEFIYLLRIYMWLESNHLLSQMLTLLSQLFILLLQNFNSISILMLFMLLIVPRILGSVILRLNLSNLILQRLFLFQVLLLQTIHLFPIIRF